MPHRKALQTRTLSTNRGDLLPGNNTKPFTALAMSS